MTSGRGRVSDPGSHGRRCDCGGDAIIQSLFDYYCKGAAAVVIIPPLYEQDVSRAITQLQDAAANHHRLWFLTDPTPRTGFPRTALSAWADAHWPRQFSQRFPAIHLPVNVTLYTPEPVVTSAPVTALDAAFGDALRLEGVIVPEVAQAGGYWQPTFYWSAAATASQYTSLRFSTLRCAMGTDRYPPLGQLPPGRLACGGTYPLPDAPTTSPRNAPRPLPGHFAPAPPKR
ncbi:MAG: hypothetical protein IPL78_29555 [Chloroflexi bacterium]|nr:hypothetical protein [Chloroflexota bacterium]